MGGLLVQSHSYISKYTEPQTAPDVELEALKAISSLEKCYRYGSPFNFVAQSQKWVNSMHNVA